MGCICCGELVGQTIYPIGSGLQRTDDNLIYWGIFIAKKDSLYFIGGDFDLADSTPVNNVTIWDGEDFVDAGQGLTGPVRDLFDYENEVYALGAQSLFKWNGELWEALSIQGSIEGKAIDNGRLYLFGQDLSADGISQADIIYLEQNQWHSIEFDWPVFPEDIAGLAVFEDTIFISAYTGTYKLLEDGSMELSIDERGRLTAIYDKLFFVVEIFGEVYEYKSNSWELIFETDGVRHEFFELENRLYLTGLNQGTFIYNGQTFENQGRGFFQVTDVERINEQDYLITGALRSSSDFYTLLHNIAVLRYEGPIVDIQLPEDTICENEYVYLNAIDNDMTMDYDWSFEGGIPAYSQERFPVVKFSEPGNYTISLQSENIIGQSDLLYRNISVLEGCEEERNLRYDNTWMLGRSLGPPIEIIAGLDFSNGDALPCAFNAPADFWGLSNSISDKNGDLLFYSNGHYIADANHNIIEHSEGFNTGSFVEVAGENVQALSQTLITIPSKENDSIFYLFHLPTDLIANGMNTLPTQLLMSQVEIVDTTGKLEMTLKRFPLVQDTLHNFLMQAHPHANGEDWWIIVPEVYSDQYYQILLKSDGTIEIDKYSLGIELERSRFQSVFSPNGKHFAVSSRSALESYLWDFNSYNGRFENLRILKPDTLFTADSPRGCAFSSNSRFLYISSYHYLRQYDLCSPAINETAVIVDEWDGFYTWIYPYSFGRMMLAPNGKIYSCAQASSSYLSTIHEPNLYGIDCDFRQHDFMAVDNSIFESNVLPEYPHYRNNLDSLLCTTAVKEVSQINFKIYPNPSSDYVNIVSSASLSDYEWEVLNAQGKRLINGRIVEENEFKLDLTELADGVYFVRIKKGMHQLVRKVIKVDTK